MEQSFPRMLSAPQLLPAMPSPLFYFPPGALVEVTYDEEGFRGAWYEATVAAATPFTRLFEVAYDALYADNDESRPLQELVLRRHVRPRPRRCRVALEVGQRVDAFHNDGWWDGVVLEVLRPGGEDGKRRYRVWFLCGGEEMEFEEGDVRLHLEWVRGEWVLPKKHSMQSSTSPCGADALPDASVHSAPMSAPVRPMASPPFCFPPGALVEVTCDEEGFQGSWYEATIATAAAPFARGYDVAYDALRADSDESKPLRERVRRKHVRPRPPRSRDALEVNQRVDAFHNDGWWDGVVLEVLCQPEGEGGDEMRKYKVWFPCSKEEIEFEEGEVRPHLEWVRGEWVLPKENGRSILDRLRPQQENEKAATDQDSPSQPIEIEDNGCDDLVHHGLKRHSYTKKRSSRMWSRSPKSANHGEYPLSGDAQICNEEKESRDMDTPLKDHKKLKSTSSSPEIHCQKPFTEVMPTNTFGRIHNDVSIALANPSKKVKVLEPHSSIRSKKTPASVIDDISRQEHGGRIRHKKLVSRRAHSKMDLLQKKETSEDGKMIRRGRGRPRIIRAPFVADNDLSRSQYCEAADATTAGADDVNNSTSSTPSNVPHNSVDAIQGRSVSILENISIQIEDSVHILTFKNSEFASGRSLDIPSEVRQTTLSQDNFNHDSGLPNVGGANPGASENEHDVAGGKTAAIAKPSIASIPELKITKVVDVAGTNGNLKLSGEPSSVNIEGDLYQLRDGKGKVVNGPPSCSPNMNEIVDGADQQTCPLSRQGAEQKDGDTYVCGEVNQVHHGYSATTVDAKLDHVNPLSLPFVKTSPLWDSIESNGVFSTMIQRPHFRPLERLCEDLREGVAIGYMLSFANFIRSLNELKIHDPVTVFEKKKSVLSHFEEQGFDIILLRECLDKALRIKRAQEAQPDKSMLEGRMKDRRDDIARLEEEINAMTKEREELEKSLAILLERLQSRILLRENATSDVDELLDEIQKLKEASLLAERDLHDALATFR